MRPKTWSGWLLGAIVLAAAVALARQFFVAFVQAVYLVDIRPWS